MSFIVNALVAVREVSINEVFKSDTIGKSAESERSDIFVLRVKVHAKLFLTELVNFVSAHFFDQLSRNGIEGLLEEIVDVVVAVRKGLTVVSRPRIAVWELHDRLVVENRAPVDEVSIKSKTVSRNRLHCRTDLSWVMAGIVSGKGSGLFAPVADQSHDLTAVIHSCKGNMREILLGFAVAVDISPASCGVQRDEV